MLVGKALPWSAGAGLAFVDAGVGDAGRRRAQQLDGPRLGEALLLLGHLGPHAVARQGAGDEDDEAVDARDTAPAEGERVDLQLELVRLVAVPERR